MATSKLVKRFAVAMKATREKLEISQEALAVKAKISVSYVSMLERGLRTPPLDTVEQVARALKVDPVVLLA